MLSDFENQINDYLENNHKRVQRYFEKKRISDFEDSCLVEGWDLFELDSEGRPQWPPVVRLDSDLDGTEDGMPFLLIGEFVKICCKITR